MPALMIPYDTIHICMHRGSCGARVGHRLERVANMIIIFIAIINIHILTSTIVQTSKLATWLI